MKRILRAICVGGLIILIGGCGSSVASEEYDTPVTGEEMVTPLDTPVPTSTSELVVETTGVPTVTLEPTQTISMLPLLMESFDRTATISETTLYDENQIKIVANSISFTKDEMILSISLTNETGEELSFSCGSATCDVNSINGIMAQDGFVSCDVPAGTTVEEQIEFSINYMVATGFNTVADFEIGFWISGDGIDNFYTGPLSVRTSQAENYDYSTNMYQKMLNDEVYEKAYGYNIKYYSTEELYKNADGTIQVVSVVIYENEVGKVVAQYEIVNSSESKVQAWGKESHINGELVKSYSSWVESINPGKTLIVSFPLTEYADEYSGEMDLSVLKEFAFTLAVGENSNIAKESGKVTVKIPNSEETTEPVIIPEPTAVPTNAPEPTATNTPTPKPTAMPVSDNTFEEMVVVENEECIIKITDIDPDNRWGYEISVYLENKSTDKTYMFSLETLVVNGVQCNCYFASEVLPGKKVNETFNIDDSHLEDNGIVDFNNIELYFRVYDSDDWSAEDIVQVCANIYPYGENKAKNYIRESKQTDYVIVDNEYVTAVVIGFEKDNIWGDTIKLYLENKTDTTVMFSVDDASVNGVMSDPFWAEEVSPGKLAFSDIEWSDSTLEENGLKEFTEFEFEFRAYDSNDWFDDDFAKERAYVYPYGKEKAGKFERETGSSDKVLIDNEYVTVVMTGSEYDSIWGYTINLYLVNKTENLLCFASDDVSVNGYMLDPYWAKEVGSGKCAFSSMSWDESEFDENGITTVEEIEMLFRAYDSDDWMADDFVNENIVIQP